MLSAYNIYLSAHYILYICTHTYICNLLFLIPSHVLSVTSDARQ